MPIEWLLSATLAVVILLVAAAIIKQRFFTNAGKEVVKRKRNSKRELDIPNLFYALGGKENVLSVDYHQSRLLVEVADYERVNIEELKVQGASGITKTSKRLTLVVGSKAASVSKYIAKKIGQK